MHDTPKLIIVDIIIIHFGLVPIMSALQSSTVITLASLAQCTNRGGSKGGQPPPNDNVGGASLPQPQTSNTEAAH